MVRSVSENSFTTALTMYLSYSSAVSFSPIRSKGVKALEPAEINIFFFFFF